MQVSASSKNVSVGNVGIRASLVITFKRHTYCIYTRDKYLSTYLLFPVEQVNPVITL